MWGAPKSHNPVGSKACYRDSSYHFIFYHVVLKEKYAISIETLGKIKKKQIIKHF
jgi:hypothetical protein